MSGDAFPIVVGIALVAAAAAFALLPFVRGAALQSMALDKAPNAGQILEKALTISSPDDVLRSAALRAMGSRSSG